VGSTKLSSPSSPAQGASTPLKYRLPRKYSSGSIGVSKPTARPTISKTKAHFFNGTHKLFNPRNYGLDPNHYYVPQGGNGQPKPPQRKQPYRDLGTDRARKYHSPTNSEHDGIFDQDPVYDGANTSRDRSSPSSVAYPSLPAEGSFNSPGDGPEIAAMKKVGQIMQYLHEVEDATDRARQLRCSL
jgi:hypothetical protein